MMGTLRRSWIAAGVLILGAGAFWLMRHREVRPASRDEARAGASRVDANFPVNEILEMPFLGKVRCHSRAETVEFTANDKQVKWPFKIYYLPNGMFVRAEFSKPGAKSYEHSPIELRNAYASG